MNDGTTIETYPPRTLGERVRWLLLTGGGLGLAPIASGTFGTLPGVALALAIDAAFDPTAALVVLWLVAVVLGVFGCSQSEFSFRVFRRDDPSAFVLDEVVGFLLTVALFVSVFGPLSPVGMAVAFVAFRACDVIKPQPAARLEELPGAWGVMADDLAAGVWAALLLVLTHLFVYGLT